MIQCPQRNSGWGVNMIKWKWLVGAVVLAALAVVIFVSWFNAQLQPTGQTMARGPNQIAFLEVRLGQGGGNVYLLDADTEQMVQLTSNYQVHYMSWSPDGGVIYLKAVSQT